MAAGATVAHAGAETDQEPAQGEQPKRKTNPGLKKVGPNQMKKKRADDDAQQKHQPPNPFRTRLEVHQPAHDAANPGNSTVQQ